MPSENLLKYFPRHIAESLRIIPDKWEHIQEIRMRTDSPLCMTVTGQNRILKTIVGKHDLETVFSNICDNSVYAYQNQIKQGFITIQGGYRVGICGTAVYSDGEINYIKDVSSLNFRIPHDIIGAADTVIPVTENNNNISGTLIISPPCGGKTTVLRDLVRQLSKRYRIAVIDERGEIGRDGIMCDVLNGYKKSEGMLQALRGLSPQAILCDEIGAADDVDAVISCMNAGVPIIATAHAGTVEELQKRPSIRAILESGAIENIILLYGSDRPGKIKNIIRVNQMVNQYENNRFADNCNNLYIHRTKDVVGIAPSDRRA